MRRFRHCPEVTLCRDVDVVVAATPAARLLGLALLRDPPPHGLLLPRCRSVHTWGMRFAIDVVFLSSGEVVAVRRSVRPWRLLWHRGADAVVELPAQSTTGATAAGAGRTNTRWPTL